MWKPARVPKRDIAPFVVCTALLALAGCGDKKSEPEAASTKNRVAADAPKQVAEPTPPGDGQEESRQDVDPLIGTWEVVKAEGFHADSNTGIVWAFEKGGKAFSIAMVDPNAKGRKPEQQVSTMGTAEKKTEWSWLRHDAGSIELSISIEPGNPARIRHRMEGEQLVLDWNNGSQILYLAKKK